MKSERQLLDEVRLREASLDDAQREHTAGELTDADFASIVERENAALHLARTELTTLAAAATQSSTVMPSTSNNTARRRKRSRLVVALVCFALAAGVLVWANLGLRQAGQSASGGLNLSQTQKVQQLVIEGEADVAAGNDAAALSAYQQILAIEPTNVAALTEAGWFDFTAGSDSKNSTVVAHGVSDLHEAVMLAPKSPAPRLYYAIVAASTPGNQALAKKEFNIFLTLKPSKAQLLIARPFLRNLGLAA
jgi:hypothetical protein